MKPKLTDLSISRQQALLAWGNQIIDPSQENKKLLSAETAFLECVHTCVCVIVTKCEGTHIIAETTTKVEAVTTYGMLT